MQNQEIYHFTHKDNIVSIIKSNGIFSTNNGKINKIEFKDASYLNIQDRRSRALVNTKINGVLHDYIPFYFAPRSPMLYAHYKNKVTSKIKQSDLVYLVSSIGSVVNDKLNYAFTDGHAAQNISSFFDDLKDLNQIDWPLMKDKMWNNTLEDTDRTRRRQAEFLVKDFFPFQLVHKIGVFDESNKKYIISILKNNDKENMVKHVFIERYWYF
nr:toxin-antitoxin system toxin DarT [Pigmentibacter ruber]